MEANEVLTRVRENMTAGTVFGEPITQDGVIVIPVARIRGGGGGGHGERPGGPSGKGTGEGLGFGIRSTPVGVFVIRDGKVHWRPAVDVNKVILGGQLVGVVALLTVRTIVKAWWTRRAAPTAG